MGRIYVDFAGPVSGIMYFAVVDSHSKWLEVIPMTSTTSGKTVEVLRFLCARHGLPKELVSDSGPQFVAEELQANGIHHTRVYLITRQQMKQQRGVCKV